MLSEETGQSPEEFHFDYFEIRDGKLYYKGKSKSLMIRGGKLRSFHEIVKILSKKGLHELGFDISRSKLTARQALKLRRLEEELPSASDVAKTDDIEIEEITKKMQ